MNVQDALKAAGLHFSGGAWLRSTEFDSLSINSSSGGWIDHRTGERGNWRKLQEKLGFAGGEVAFTSPRPEASTDSGTTQIARTLWARSTSAVPPKMPKKGWSKAAWEQHNAKYQDQREAVADYLLSRGLDPAGLLPMIRISELGSSEMDQKMQAKGADFCFLVPMYSIGKPEIAGNICGVQRTYLKFSEDKYHRVEKIGRGMLGKKGATTLSPDPKFSPVLSPEHSVLAAGEGFETVGSYVQVMHRPAVVCWDWSGLKRWSEALAPSASAPTVAFLVDADASETGQRECAAAVRRIKKKGGKAVYLLPPESIITDAKGNRDWNDLLQQKPDDFAVEIVKAWHQSEHNLAQAPKVDGKEDRFTGAKRASVAQLVADCVARDVAHAQARQALIDYLPAWRECLRALAEYKDLSPEERKARGLKRPKLPPLLLKITTGVGKSHLIREILKAPEFRDLAFLILTRTHALAEEYADAGASQYFGRSEPFFDPINEKDGYTEADLEKNHFGVSTCFKYKVVELVSENNHVPALTACRSCEHGRKFMIENYHEKSQPFADAVAWFSQNGFSQQQVSRVAACQWLSHKAHISRQRVIVAPNASYSDDLATWKGAPSGKDEPRLVIIDEIPELSRHIEVTSADLGIHARNLANILSSEKFDENEEIREDFQNAGDLLKDIALFLASSVGKKETGMNALSDEILEKAKGLHVNWLPGATSRWEKAELKYGREVFVPLRMTKALIQSAAHGVGKVVDGTLHLHEVTNLGERIAKGKSTILLDATPSPAIESLIVKNGGNVVNSIAKQYVKIVHFNQYLHGRTWKNKKHQEQELERLYLLREQMTREVGETPAALTYMPHCQMAGMDKDPDWGYFGRDDVGQDNWKGRHLLIFGGPLFSPVTQEVTYDSELLLRRIAGDDSMPDWSGKVERGQEVVVGEFVDTSKAPLPTNPALREWVLDNYARRIVQGIGRVRGVWADPAKPLQVWIAGGLPLSGLARHGLAVSEFKQEHVNMNDQAREDAKRKVQMAVASLQAADQDASYRAVQKKLEAMGLPGVRYEAWKKATQGSVYDPDNTAYKGVDTLLDLLGAIQTAAEIGQTGIVDAALSIWKHPRSGSELRVAARLVLESSPDARQWRKNCTGASSFAPPAPD